MDFEKKATDSDADSCAKIDAQEENEKAESVVSEKQVVPQIVAFEAEIGNPSNEAILSNDEIIVENIQKECDSEFDVCDKMKNMRIDTEYPEECNPFGDDENEEEAEPQQLQNYPDSLNPFGDDLETDENQPTGDSVITKASTTNGYNSSLNPFGSDDSDDEPETSVPTSLPVTPIPAPRRSVQAPLKSTSNSTQFYSTSSLERNKGKCDKPPRPPPPKTEQNPGMRHSETSASLDSMKMDSKSRSISPLNSTPDAKKRVYKKKPAPKPPSVNDNVSLKSEAISNFSVESGSIPNTPEVLRRTSSKRSSPDVRDSLSPSISTRSGSPVSLNDANSELTSNDTSFEISKALNQWRNKKRKAPPIPIPKRRITKVSVEEIEKELDTIGNKLQVNDKRTMEILESFQKVGTTHKQKKLIYEYLLLSHEKCSLAKKQEELMFLKREHKLEEDHADIEYELRIIMAKPDSMKSEEDKVKEQELLERLVEIIEGRNDIVENMIKIDKRIDFNILVRKVMEIKGEAIVTPILNTFMKNSYNSSEIKYSKKKSKEKNKAKDAKNEKSEKSAKSAFRSLKKIAKVN